MKSIAMLVSLMFAGCASTDVPEVDLKDGGLAIEVAHWTTSPNDFALQVSKAGPSPATNAAQPADCIQLRGSTTITANDTAGTLLYTGGIEGELEQNCQPAQLAVHLDPLPPTIAIALDDGTATLELDLVLDAGGYQITRCGAASCTIDQTHSP
jgi:hypothetical protein